MFPDVATKQIQNKWIKKNKKQSIVVTLQSWKN